MKRIKQTPRNGWGKLVESVGMNYHTIDGKIYWDESVAYEFDESFIDKIDDATQNLHNTCLEFLDSIISTGNYSYYWFQDNDLIINLIEKSWKEQHPSLYGRFDLGIDKSGNIKMLEYNADTPTGLLEASVVQWNWKQDTLPNYDQFNSIHEKLVKRWQSLRPLTNVYFTAMTDSPYEDWGNVHYLLETLVEAGYNGSSIDLEFVGWNGESFVDMNNNPIEILFKLYPWEWIANDEFVNNIPNAKTAFIEPAWKMLLSNKLLTVKLWEMFPTNPYLLEAKIDDTNLNSRKKWIQKPMLGREGQGVEDYSIGWFFNSEYKQGNILQEKMNIATFDGQTPVIGSWIIGNETAGIGIREDKGVTTNNSRFIPHYFVP